MKLYKVINNSTGRETNRFTSEMGLDETYWEPSFGNQTWTEQILVSPETTEMVVVQPEITDAEGNVTQPEITEERIVPAVYQNVIHPGEYLIVEEDITAELLDNSARENEIIAAKEALQSISTGTLTEIELSEAIRNIAKVLS